MPTNKIEVSENPTTILHSRYGDGQHRIEIVPGVGYQVLDTGALYTSKRSLLQSLTGHPKGRNWTLDRYLKLNRNDSVTHPGASILDIFGHTPRPLGSSGLTLDRSGIVRSSVGKLDFGLTVAPTAPKPLGIDLQRRSKEVQKLLFHGFGHKIFSQGYDPNEVLQEVFKGILARNNGTCAWDADKSSFGHYVHMVCGCILANYHRREQRRRAVEQVGLTVPSSDHESRYQEMDVGDAVSNQAMASLWGDARQDISNLTEDDLVAHLRSGTGRHKDSEVQMAISLIPLARQGMSRAEMAYVLGESKANVGRALAHLKSKTKGWAQP